MGICASPQNLLLRFTLTRKATYMELLLYTSTLSVVTYYGVSNSREYSCAHVQFVLAAFLNMETIIRWFHSEHAWNVIMRSTPRDYFGGLVQFSLRVYFSYGKLDHFISHRRSLCAVARMSNVWYGFHARVSISVWIEKNGTLCNKISRLPAVSVPKLC